MRPSEAALKAAESWISGTVTTAEDERLQLAATFDAFAAEAVKAALGMAIPNVVGADGRKQQILEEIRARGKTSG